VFRRGQSPLQPKHTSDEVSPQDLRARLIPNPNPDPNRWNRIEYMLGDITEAQFKFRIQCADKAREKEAAIEAIFRMFIDVGTDLMRSLVVTENVDEFIEQREWLYTYANAQLDDIRNCYRTKVPRITELEVLYI